jgi:hypothetical protein
MSEACATVAWRLRGESSEPPTARSDSSIWSKQRFVCSAIVPPGAIIPETYTVVPGPLTATALL